MRPTQAFDGHSVGHDLASLPKLSSAQVSVIEGGGGLGQCLGVLAMQHAHLWTYRS